MKKDHQTNTNSIRKNLIAKYKREIKNNLYHIKSLEIAEKIAQRLREEAR